jgi:peptidoglycan hydrolase CwlO-like protein
MWWSKWKVPIIISAVVIVIMIIAWFLMGKDYAVEIVNDLVKGQVTQITEGYDRRIKESERKVESYDKQIKSLKKQQKEIENEMAKIKPPESSDELRDRLRSLGLHPLN